MSKSRFIRFSNGVVFSLDAVRLIARKDLNEYLIVLEGTGVQPKGDADDVAFLESQFDIVVAPDRGDKVALPLEKPVTKLAIPE